MNNVSITGRLVRDPNTITTSNNSRMSRFTLAVQRPGTADKADFLPVIAFGHEAEFAGKYFKKGSFVGVQGKVITGSYEKDGRTIYTTDVQADRLSFEGKASTPKDPTPPGFVTVEDDIPF